MLRNLRTVRPIFPKIAPKVVQDFKEKSHESLRRGKKFPRNYRAKRRGGADSAPPPPVLLGLTLMIPLCIDHVIVNIARKLHWIRGILRSTQCHTSASQKKNECRISGSIIILGLALN